MFSPFIQPGPLAGHKAGFVRGALSPTIPAYPAILNSSYAWFRADSNITLNGSTVSAWAGRNGNVTATQSTEADQPTYTASVIGGRPGLTFDGNDLLEMDSLASLHSGSDKSFSFFCTVEITNLGVIRNTIFCFGSSSSVTPKMRIAAWDDDTWAVDRSDDAGSPSLAKGGTVDTDPHILTSVFTGTAISVWIDGAVVINNVSMDVGALTVDQATLGSLRRTTNEQFLTGSLSEAAFYAGQWSTNERQSIEAYASNRYGIALT